MTPAARRASPQTARAAAVSQEQARSFLRMAAHELRTPLNSILGFSEILARELYGPLGAPQYREYAGIIHESGQRLLKLVNQVMEIARLESGSIDWDLRAEALDQAVEDVVATFGQEIGARRLAIEISPAKTLPRVTADPRGLRTVLSGLIHNAVVFSPEGSTVRISAVGGRATVDLAIENEAEKIDPAELARLMKPFVQGQSAPTRATEGAGLGLPICALTCRAMGGRLILSNPTGRRLRATVQLPTA